MSLVFEFTLINVFLIIILFILIIILVLEPQKQKISRVRQSEDILNIKKQIQS